VGRDGSLRYRGRTDSWSPDACRIIVAEQDAFEDVRDAEEKWARPDAIVWTKRGALGGDKPKIIPRPGGTFPQGHIQLMEFAISAIRDVTGINLELLGLRDQNQPGILEAQRKQAGMTVLATVFGSLRRFRKLGGRIRLHVVQNYLSDGRLIRIVGLNGAKAIPLMKDKTFGDYDVVIDDAPTPPNQKEQNCRLVFHRRAMQFSKRALRSRVPRFSGSAPQPVLQCSKREMDLGLLRRRLDKPLRLELPSLGRLGT
jgi:hypothetical protein